MTFSRWISAFFSAPAIPALSLGVLYYFQDGWFWAWRGVLQMLALAYATMLVLGVPAYFIFVHGRRPSLLKAVLIGAGVSGMPLFLISIVSVGLSARLVELLPAVLMYAAPGAVGGATAWYVAYKFKPETGART